MNSFKPLKHHYVPECYFKTFLNSQKQMWRKSNGTSKSYLCNPAQVCYEIGINEIKTPEILKNNQLVDSLHIEKYSFVKQENNYHKTVKKLIVHSSVPFAVSKDQYRLFVETLVTIKRRNPKTRTEIINAFTNGYNSEGAVEEFKKYLIEESKKLGIELDIDLDDYVKEYLKSKAGNLQWKHDMYLTGHLKSDSYDVINKITNQLYNLKQVILLSQSNTQFITSDNPGFVKKENMILSIGGLVSPFEFYFPLSPSACLYVNSEIQESSSLTEKLIHSTVISQQEVTMINKFTSFVSNKMLFANNKTVFEGI